MFVTFVVVRFAIPVIAVSFVQSANQQQHDVGFTFLKESSNFTVVMVPLTVFTQPGVEVPVAVTAVPLHTFVTVCPPYVLPTLTGSP